MREVSLPTGGGGESIAAMRTNRDLPAAMSSGISKE